MSIDPKDPNRVIIFDTTLRDGEQSPGASMNLEEKLKIALALEALGVDVMEAGFPRSSHGDFMAVNAIAKAVKKSVVCGLSRASKEDIDRAAEAIAPAARGRIHTFISTSPVHMKAKLKMEPEQVLAAVSESVAYARNLCGDVEWSAEDATRTEKDFLCRCVEAAIKAGATTINIPDTVGYTTPAEYTALFQMLIERVPNADKAIFSTHCHNDLGMATANSLSGIIGGARQIECTVNGLGERAGNAALEEIAMALRTRRDVMPFTCGIRTEGITKISHLVSGISGFVVQPNKAIVGKNAFSHESGIHQDGMIKNRETYEIMTPESVGLTQSSLKLGKLSGKNAFKTKLQEMGYELSKDELNDAFKRFKDLADQKRNVFDEDLAALVDDGREKPEDAIKFIGLDVASGTGKNPKARLELLVDFKKHSAEATGNGLIDAAFNAIKEIVPHEETKFHELQIKSVTEGTDAQADVTVKLEENGRVTAGRGTDIDTVVASTKAYIGALNKIQAEKRRPKGPKTEP